jgi:2-oxoglutarate dehydrogenase E2 component (dihydrolipoamide succinyltransferase)
MSLEQALADNTAALRELAALFANSKLPPVPAPVPEPTPAPAAKAPAPKPEPKPEPKPAPKPEPKPEVKAAPAALDYAAVGTAITAYAAKHGREATLTKLGALGVKSGKELKPDKYAEALALFTAPDEEVE